MKIAVFGYTDKRIVILSLLKILQSTGEVCLLTDNKHYTRYIEGHQEIGTFNSIHIAVTDVEPEYVFDAIGIPEESFNHIIHDCRTQLPEGIDLIIYVASNYIDEDEQNLLMSLVDAHPIYQVYENKKRTQTYMPGYNMEKTINRTKVLKGIEGNFEKLSKETVYFELPKELQLSSSNSYTITMPLISTLEESECFKIIPPIDSKSLSSILQGILEKELNIGSDTMYGLMMGRWQN